MVPHCPARAPPVRTVEPPDRLGAAPRVRMDTSTTSTVAGRPNTDPAAVVTRRWPWPINGAPRRCASLTQRGAGFALTYRVLASPERRRQRGRGRLSGRRRHLVAVFPHEVGPHHCDQWRSVGPAVVVPLAVPRHPAAEIASQIDVFALYERATVAPAGRRPKRAQWHRHQLALLVMALADAHARPLCAVGLVDRVVAGGHGHPVVEQRASLEVGDLSCHAGILLSPARRPDLAPHF